MSDPLPGISQANWLAIPPRVREIVGQALLLRQENAQMRQENDQLQQQLISLATELTELREWIGRSSRISSKPPSSDAPGFKPPERQKGSGRKRGGQSGHPGAGPELLPVERVGDVQEHNPQRCLRCGNRLLGDDWEPLVIEHRMHRLVCSCSTTSTCATMPDDVGASYYGPRLSALVGLLGDAAAERPAPPERLRLSLTPAIHFLSF